ncbi:ABC transporter ATP-binding protein [Amycolatopsis suaedae]|uniref:ABC transporter ATP-binding protein n=1 Tax=Amycolatopsis suaedae TaxID=2510978 RepID=UPI001F101F8F|nr:ABC transporter ATP-binding protein [Amycolatopsis suaedae]
MSGAGNLATLLRYIRPHRAMLTIVGTLTLCSSAASLAQPMIIEDVLLALGADGDLTNPLLLLAGLLVVSAALTGLTVWLTSRTSERVVLHLRRTLIHRLIRLRVRETDNTPVGDLTTRVTSDTTVLQQAASAGVIQLLDGAVTLVAACVLMGMLDWRLFLVSFGVLVVVGLIGGIVMPRIRRASQAVQEQIGAVGAVLERALSATRTVKANAAEPVETAAADQAARLAYRAGLRGAKYDAVIGVLTGTAVQVSFLIVLGVGGAMVAAGSLHVATLIAFLLYLFRMMGPVAGLVSGVSTVFQGFGAVSRIEQVEKMEIEDDVDVRIPARPRTAPTLRFDNVRFGYPDRNFRIDGVTLSARAGERTAVVGPSGAGKTTLFALAERFYQPDSGRILLDEVDTATLTRAELRRRIAYVEQDSTMLSGSIHDNLTYGATTASGDEIRQVLAATGLTGFVDELPDGLATEVGSRGAMLSGGQRQRLAIARALLRRPDVLLLDEITAQLDARNEEALRQTVESVAKQCTVLLIAHRLSTVVSADQIVVMQNGTVRATGNHKQLLATSDLYRELAATQLLTPNTPADAGMSPAGPSLHRTSSAGH